MAQQQLLEHGLSKIKRYITDHDSQGLAIFSQKLGDELEWQDIGNMAKFALGYTTKTFPVDLTDTADISSYEGFLQNKPGITIPGGTVLRTVDMAPGSVSPMHRTVSLDYGVVLEGEVELVLDSGEKRIMRRGDVAIQRATNHAWINTSQETWARMLFVLQESQPLVVGGKKLEEHYGSGIPGVKSSTEGEA